MSDDARRIPCAGAVVLHEGRLLVVQRAHEPSRGLWSVPGGRVEDGESREAACVREVREECGIDVVVRRLAGTVERPGLDGSTYVIEDFVCDLVGSSSLVAGDDAADARWVTRAELESLPCTPGLVDMLDWWGVLPP
jgi:ADP-ribose pyrophosphatase YjhB (NUDIX family)